MRLSGIVKKVLDTLYCAPVAKTPKKQPRRPPKRAKKTAKKAATKTASKGNGKAAKVAKPDQVTFHYLKGPDFRTIHVDGAIGGLTPSGHLHIAFYAERMAIPQQTTQQVNPDGTLGDESTREVKEGVVRQMETDIIVNESTARNIKVWLDQKLEEFEVRRKAVEALKKAK